MTDTEDLKERREQLLRYCVMERESTDPLALGLLHDIVLELQADLQAVPPSCDASLSRSPTTWCRCARAIARE